MYTVSTEHYCGLPQELWDNLASEAEDLLTEENLGNHLLGVYPAGDRIYGIESSSQGLLCLYMDTVESLLDPRHLNEWKFKSYNIGNQNSPVYYIELHSWIRWICNRFYDYNTDHSKLFMDIIPCFSDVIYQDPSIDNIIALATEIQIKELYSRYLTAPWPLCFRAREPSQTEIRDYILHARTYNILLDKNIFRPNINPDHGIVYEFKGELSVLDETIKDLILERKKIDFNFAKTYLKLLFYWKDSIPLTYHMPSTKVEQLAKETIKLYKVFV